jgi:hypothetical protein
VSGIHPGVAPPRPVELTIVVESEIRPWVYPPMMDFQYGEWWRERFQRGEVEPWPMRINPDLTLLVMMALLGDVTLAGPPVCEVFDPIPRGDFIDALVADIGALVKDIESDTRNVVLTLARIWNGVVTGEVQSKDAAAEWALRRIASDHGAVLARARSLEGCGRVSRLSTIRRPGWPEGRTISAWRSGGSRWRWVISPTAG